VWPTEWHCQFEDGSNEKSAITSLPNLYDQNPDTSFHYIYWQSQGNDNIPEITCYFDGTVSMSTMGVTPGKANSSSSYNENAKPDLFTVRIYSNEGITERSIRIPVSHTRNLNVYDLGGTYTGVTKVEIFVTGFRTGSSNRYDIHISEIRFFE
jgi:hypothetical protein